MIKNFAALALASAVFATPTFAQDVDAPVAPVLAADKLPSSGLAAAGAVAGAGVLAIVAVAFIAADDDDDAAVATTTGTR